MGCGRARPGAIDWLGNRAPQARGRALWSRARGMVSPRPRASTPRRAGLSGMGRDAAGAVSAGLLMPDGRGRLDFFETPPDIPPQPPWPSPSPRPAGGLPRQRVRST